MAKRYKAPYVYQEFPKMMYHNVTGESKIFNSEDEVDKDYVPLDQVGKAKKDKKPAKNKKPKAPKKDEATNDADAGDDGDDGDAGGDEKITLKGIGVTRKEAMEALKEAKISFKATATNDELASLLEPLLVEEED